MIMVNQNILILRPKFNICWAIFIMLFLTFNTSGLTMNKLILALLTVGAIATAAIPANADEIGNVQTSDQNSVITGTGNVTNQRVDQRGQVNRKVNRSGDGVPGDSANIQDARQNSDVLGDGNLTNQQTRQGYKEKRTVRERQ